MEVIPAIDLMDGLVVRLTRGDSKTAKTYQHLGKPVQVAKKWESEGAKTIHIVDLDAAMGRGDNKEVIANIILETRVAVQLGGGLRTRRIVEEMFSLGVKRAVLGTLAFEKTPELLHLLKKYGEERIMVALDYLNNHVMISGWKNATNYTLEAALNKFLNLGVEAFLLTSISRDGLLIGPDYTMLERVAKHFRAKIYAAGGIGSLEDLIILKRIGAWGVVVGKAVYENRFTLKEAIGITKN